MVLLCLCAVGSPPHPLVVRDRDPLRCCCSRIKSLTPLQLHSLTHVLGKKYLERYRLELYLQWYYRRVKALFFSVACVCFCRLLVLYLCWCSMYYWPYIGANVIQVPGNIICTRHYTVCTQGCMLDDTWRNPWCLRGARYEF